MSTEQRLLIVDDDERICRSIERVAVNSGIDVVTLSNPENFEETYNSISPSLLFLDLNMPNIDGIQLLQKLKSAKSFPNIYIMSGVDPAVVATTQRIANWEGVPIKGIMTKPLDWAKILEIFSNTKHANFGKTNHSDFDKFDKDIANNPKITYSEVDLDLAIKKNQISVNYQPKIDLLSGKLLGVEALARWTHPKLGNIPPSNFIQFAEQSGLIKKLTFCVFSYAIADYMMLKGRLGEINLALNLSNKLLDDPDIADELEDLFCNANISAKNISLEITETAYCENEVRAMENLSRLRMKGFGLSIDDYGTGDSSLNKLLNIPFSELKIDRQFVKDLLEDGKAKIMVESALELAKNLDLKSVAEGIEDNETMRWLMQKGCDVGQGYHISPPLSAIRLIKWFYEKAEKDAEYKSLEDHTLLSRIN